LTIEEYDPVKRSMENMAYMYRDELLKIADGHKSTIIPRRVRITLQGYGILFKFGNKITVTDLGKSLLIL